MIHTNRLQIPGRVLYKKTRGAEARLAEFLLQRGLKLVEDLDNVEENRRYAKRSNGPGKLGAHMIEAQGSGSRIFSGL